MIDVDDVRRRALSLPEAVEADRHHFPSYRVAGKIFSTLRPDAALIDTLLKLAWTHVAPRRLRGAA